MYSYESVPYFFRPLAPAGGRPRRRRRKNDENMSIHRLVDRVLERLIEEEFDEFRNHKKKKEEKKPEDKKKGANLFQVAFLLTLASPFIGLGYAMFILKMVDNFKAMLH